MPYFNVFHTKLDILHVVFIYFCKFLYVNANLYVHVNCIIIYVRCAEIIVCCTNILSCYVNFNTCCMIFGV